jgi:hypothetical protein
MIFYPLPLQIFGGTIIAISLVILLGYFVWGAMAFLVGFAMMASLALGMVLGYWLHVIMTRRYLLEIKAYLHMMFQFMKGRKEDRLNRTVKFAGQLWEALRNVVEISNLVVFDMQNYEFPSHIEQRLVNLRHHIDIARRLLSDSDDKAA